MGYRVTAAKRRKRPNAEKPQSNWGPQAGHGQSLWQKNGGQKNNCSFLFLPHIFLPRVQPIGLAAQNLVMVERSSGIARQNKRPFAVFVLFCGHIGVSYPANASVTHPFWLVSSLVDSAGPRWNPQAKHHEGE